MDNNEYIVEFVDSTKAKFKTIPSLIQDFKERDLAVTPIVHSLFATLEYLAVVAIVVDRNNKVMVQFSQNENMKLIIKQLGKTYLISLVSEIYKALQGLGIKSFSRNNKNRKWKKNFILTDQKLKTLLEQSIKNEQ